MYLELALACEPQPQTGVASLSALGIIETQAALDLSASSEVLLVFPCVLSSCCLHTCWCMLTRSYQKTQLQHHGIMQYGLPCVHKNESPYLLSTACHEEQACISSTSRQTCVQSAKALLWLTYEEPVPHLCCDKHHTVPNTCCLVIAVSTQTQERVCPTCEGYGMF